MPLSNGYGVVVGSVADHRIEPPDDEGRWPHYQIFVDTPTGRYECVINLKSRTEVKIEYRDFRNLTRRHFSSILELPDGLHRLESRPGSGALDFIRHPGLRDQRCVLPLPWKVPHRARPSLRKLRKGWISRTCPCTRWWRESGLDLVQLMEYYLTSVARIYIFGEPYETGLGVHNVHMTQGDPVESPFAYENGIWQDGGLLLEYTDPEPRLSALMTKFETQSLHTDEDGHPI